jgi:hypothetical protein
MWGYVTGKLKITFSRVLPEGSELLFKKTPGIMRFRYRQNKTKRDLSFYVLMENIL